MATKMVYIYKVELGHNGKIEETKYCYARNEKKAKEYYKEKYRDKKYDTFKATAFGDVELRRHPEPVEEMPEDVVNYITDNHLGSQPLYSNRKDNRIPTGGEFVPINKES